MSLSAIAALSREFGSDEKYVLAGGGNTSWKDDKFLYVKASGFALSTIEANGFVKMDRGRLAEIWERDYPKGAAEREKVALTDLMAAKSPNQEGKRPSVETLLHEAIEGEYVVHTHPSLINGLTCSRQGEKAAKDLLGDSVLWIPLVNPGYVLALTVYRALEEYRNAYSCSPRYILLQNHGVFIAGNTPGEVKERYRSLFASLEATLVQTPDVSPVVPDMAVVEETKQHIAGCKDMDDVQVEFLANGEISKALSTYDRFQAVSSAFTPDHIVYSGHVPLYLPEGRRQIAAICEEIGKYIEKYGNRPKLIAVSGLGAFGCGSGAKDAENAIALFGDAVNVSVYAENFGGPRFMDQDQIEFIRNWEVEQYRAKMGGMSKEEGES